jgi:cation:H+ antiporter
MNPMLWAGIAIGLGLVTLVVGAELLVRGASKLAVAMRVSPLVVGLTVVAFGTSAPELAVSTQAALAGNADIGLGNVVGSNLFNILCVLGVSSLVAEQGVGISPVALRFDIPVMIAVAVACLPIFFTGHCIARWEGGLFVGYYVAYTTYLILEAVGSPFGRTLASVMLVVVLPLTAITLGVTSFRSYRQQRNAAQVRSGTPSTL